METKSAAIHRKMPMPARQLPITDFAHKAAVVGDLRVRAILTALDMAAESDRATALDCRHHLQLADADMTGIGFTPSGPVVAEDIRDLQGGASHDRRGYAGGLLSDRSGVSRSNGLMTERITLVATCA